MCVIREVVIHKFRIKVMEKYIIKLDQSHGLGAKFDTNDEPKTTQYLPLR